MELWWWEVIRKMYHGFRAALCAATFPRPKSRSRKTSDCCFIQSHQLVRSSLQIFAPNSR